MQPRSVRERERESSQSVPLSLTHSHMERRNIEPKEIRRQERTFGVEPVQGLGLRLRACVRAMEERIKADKLRRKVHLRK